LDLGWLMALHGTIVAQATSDAVSSATKGYLPRFVPRSREPSRTTLRRSRSSF
jgi:hypothetical protein